MRFTECRINIFCWLGYFLIPYQRAELIELYIVLVIFSLQSAPLRISNGLALTPTCYEVYMYNPITNKPFVCDRVTQLRRRLSTDRNEIRHADPEPVRERCYGNRFGIRQITNLLL